MLWSYQEDNRKGDHIWWISNTQKFEKHYPDWKRDYDVNRILAEIVSFQEELLEQKTSLRSASA